MKFTIPNCPHCGALAKGTLEIVNGLALLNPPDAEGNFEYAGETQIDWDSQRSCGGDHDYILECPNGHNWPSPSEDEDLTAIENQKSKFENTNE